MQHNKYVENQDVIIHCITNQFTELKFLGENKKPHYVLGLGKHYHVRFYPKLGHGIYAINCIPCDCTVCTSIINQTSIPGFP